MEHARHYSQLGFKKIDQIGRWQREKHVYKSLMSQKGALGLTPAEIKAQKASIKYYFQTDY